MPNPSDQQTLDLTTCILGSNSLDQIHRFVALFPEASLSKVLHQIKCATPSEAFKTHIALFVVQEDLKRSSNKGNLIYSEFFQALRDNPPRSDMKMLWDIHGQIWDDVVKATSVRQRKDWAVSFLIGFQEMLELVPQKSIKEVIPLCDQIVRSSHPEDRMFFAGTFEKILPLWKKHTTLEKEQFSEVVKITQAHLLQEEVETMVGNLMYGTNKWVTPLWTDPKFYTPEVRKHLLSMCQKNHGLVSVLHEMQKKFGVEFVRSLDITPSLLAENLIHLQRHVSSWSPSECMNVDVLSWISEEKQVELAQILQCSSAFLRTSESFLLEKVRQDLIGKKLGNAPLRELDFKAFFKEASEENGRPQHFLENIMLQALIGLKVTASHDAKNMKWSLSVWKNLVHPTTHALIQLVYEQSHHPDLKPSPYKIEDLPAIKNLKTLSQSKSLTSSFSVDRLLEIYRSKEDRRHLTKKVLKHTPKSSAPSRKL